MRPVAVYLAAVPPVEGQSAAVARPAAVPPVAELPVSAVLRAEDPAKAAVYPAAVQQVADRPIVDRLAAAVLRVADPVKAAVYPAAVYPTVVQPEAGLPLRVLQRGRPPAVRTQPTAALTAVPDRLPQAIQPVKLLPPTIPSKKAPPLQAQRATPILPTKLPLRAVNPIRLLLKAYHPTRTPVIQKHPVSHTLITTLQIQLLKKQVRLIRTNPGKTTLNRQLNQGRIPRKPVLLPINLLQAGTGV